MLYREIIAVCSQIHTKHINTLYGQNVELYIKTQSVPRSKHSVSVIKTSQLTLILLTWRKWWAPNNASKWQMGFNSAFKGLMLYWEIIAVYSQIHTKHINTLCGQNVEFVNVKPIDTQSDHWALRDNFCIVIYIYSHNKMLTTICKTNSSV